MQVLCWLAPGIVILRKGILAMLAVAENTPQQVWWLSLIAVGVLVAFLLMFHKFINRHTERILNFPSPKKSLFAFFDLRGYILIIFMMGLGISLKYIHFLPVQFFAAFYPGLGGALTISGIRFFVSWIKANYQTETNYVSTPCKVTFFCIYTNIIFESTLKSA